MGLLVFLLLGADMLSVLLARLLDGRSLSDHGFWSDNWYATVGGSLCSSLIWALSIWGFTSWAHRNGVLRRLVSWRADGRAWATATVGAALIGVAGWLQTTADGGTFPSVASELGGFRQLYPGHGGVVTTFQYLYYLLEAGMVVLLVALYQRAGERWTGKMRVPWGAVGLGLTWGVAHLGSHPHGALLVVGIAVFYGIAFSVSRKSAPAVLALVYLGFVL